jgi:hypothetical protein
MITAVRSEQMGVSKCQTVACSMKFPKIIFFSK